MLHAGQAAYRRIAPGSNPLPTKRATSAPAESNPSKLNIPYELNRQYRRSVANSGFGWS